MFLHGMLLSDNHVLKCIMLIWVHYDEYTELFEHCELSTLESVTYIKRSLYDKFCDD